MKAISCMTRIEVVMRKDQPYIDREIQLGIGIALWNFDRTNYNGQGVPSKGQL